MKYNVIFEYNNVENPYLIIRTYENDAQTNKEIINLTQNSMVDGLPEDVDAFINEIDHILQYKSAVREKALFVLNCAEQTKITFTLPKLNDRKIKKLYENEVVEKIKDVNSYVRSSYTSENDKEKIYYEYLLNRKYVEYFKYIGGKLGFLESSCLLLSDYLFETVKAKIADKTYCYFYEESGVISMITVINGNLCSFASFLKTKTNFNLYLTSILDNHYLNLEKVKVEKTQFNKEIYF